MRAMTCVNDAQGMPAMGQCPRTAPDSAGNAEAYGAFCLVRWPSRWHADPCPLISALPSATGGGIAGRGCAQRALISIDQHIAILYHIYRNERIVN